MHPDVNALADLAADVLPVEEARAVEAHVIQCPACADLLADSERIRPLLLSDDVGPMPDDVWQRLSGVLAEESSARSALDGHLVPMAPVPAPSSAPWDQHWQVDEAQASADATDTQWWAGQQDGGWDRSPLDPGAAAGAAPAAAAENTVRDQHVPPTDGLVRRRRDADARLDRAGDDPTFDSTEVWDSFDLRDRNVPPAAAAPGAPSDGDDGTGLTRVVRPLADLSPGAPGDTGERPNETTSTLSALGGGRVSGLRKPGRVGGPSRRDVRDSSRAEKGPGRLRSLATGRRAPLLAAAAGVVVAAGIGGFAWNALTGDGGTTRGGTDAALPSLAPVSARVLTTGKNYSEAGLGDEAKALVKQAATVKPGSPSVQANFTGNAAIAQPKVLAKCLDALNASSQTPLAVDLAQYKNREAAIIVLTGQDGGYEVWAVSRDCGSGDESTLSFVAVPAD